MTFATKAPACQHLSESRLLFQTGNEKEYCAVGYQAFHYTKYPKEENGNLEFTRYHQKELARHGVPIAPGGLEVSSVCLHKQIFRFQVSEEDDTTVAGGTDSIVHEYGLFGPQPSDCLAIFDQKQNAADKAAYVEEHPKAQTVSHAC